MKRANIAPVPNNLARVCTAPDFLLRGYRAQSLDLPTKWYRMVCVWALIPLFSSLFIIVLTGSLELINHKQWGMHASEYVAIIVPIRPALPRRRFVHIPRFASPCYRDGSLELREAAHFIDSSLYVVDKILGGQIAVYKDDSIVSCEHSNGGHPTTKEQYIMHSYTYNGQMGVLYLLYQL